MARSKRKRQTSYAPRDRRIAFNDHRDSIDDGYQSGGASHIDANRTVAPRSLVHRLRVAAAKAGIQPAGVWGGLAPYRYPLVNTLRSALASAHVAFPRSAPASPPRFVSGMNLLPVLPRQTVVCVSRRRRREVLFALRKAGFSGSAPNRYRRTLDSQRSC